MIMAAGIDSPLFEKSENVYFHSSWLVESAIFLRKSDKDLEQLVKT